MLHDVEKNQLWKILRCQKLRYLELSGIELIDADFFQIHKLKNLLELRLRDARSITNKALFSIGQINGLRKLELARCYHLNSAGLRHLTNFKNLSSLRLTDLYIKTLRWLPVKQLSTLSRLHFINVTDLKEDVGVIRFLPALKDLCIDSNKKITGKELLTLRKMKLKKLRLSYCSRLTKEVVEVFKNIKTLNDLNLIGLKQLTALELSQILKLPNLRTLTLSYCEKLDDSVLKSIGELDNLISLDLVGCRLVTNVGFVELAKLHKLEILKIAGCENISDVGLKSLKRLTNITELDLSGCSRITDVGIGNLRPLKKLKIVDLASCHRLSNKSLTFVGQLTLLEELRLSYNYNISKLGFQSIANLKNLRRLYVEECGLVNDDCVRALSKMNSLVELTLVSCQLTDKSIKHLASFPKLAVLEVGGCEQISPMGINQLKKRRPNLQIIGE